MKVLKGEKETLYIETCNACPCFCVGKPPHENIMACGELGLFNSLSMSDTFDTKVLDNCPLPDYKE